MINRAVSDVSLMCQMAQCGSKTTFLRGGGVFTRTFSLWFSASAPYSMPDNLALSLAFTRVSGLDFSFGIAQTE